MKIRIRKFNKFEALTFGINDVPHDRQLKRSSVEDVFFQQAGLSNEDIVSETRNASLLMETNRILQKSGFEKEFGVVGTSRDLSNKSSVLKHVFSCIVRV